MVLKKTVESPLGSKEIKSVTPKENEICSVVSNSLRPHELLQAKILEWVVFPFSRGSSQPRDQTQVSHIAGDSLSLEPQGKSKNTGVGSLSLLQQIVPTQGSNRGLPHCRQILYHLSHKGSPRILESVAYPFSSRSSQPRIQTRVSCVTGGFFTN